ncbi:hypothetical protein [Streptomyces decoyicus]
MPPAGKCPDCKYTTAMFGKLGITDDDNSNRRVLAVLAYLNKP